MNYYNDNDASCCAWLRELISARLIPAGEIDSRSICEVQPSDVKGFTQCHFFAGIAGWPYALQLAGWPEDQPVWTGSCPCQPLSCAGQQKGHADERHLWPAFYRLIAECRPPVVFGEQIASKDGREWLAGVRADLEEVGYACGCADLCAASVGAPHIRQRLFWVGDTKKPRLERCPQQSDGEEWQAAERTGTELGFWFSAIWHPCRDGKVRRISPEPALFPLAPRLPGRVGLLRGAGNAIVPQVAAEFVKAYLTL